MVEDDPDGADVVFWLLKSGGYQPIHFDTAEAALQVLDAEPDRFAAGLFDLALPGMDGFELATRIRARSDEAASMRLIAMTAFHTPELRVRTLESGFDAYFAKPLDTAIFLGSFERVLKS
jgi:two-component system cell cycle response regulator DivK